jgi:hypothetical protein
MSKAESYWDKPTVKIYIGDHLKYKMCRVVFMESAVYFIRRSFPFAGKSRIELRIKDGVMRIVIVPTGSKSLQSLSVGGKGNFLRANSTILAARPDLQTGYFMLSGPTKSNYGTPMYKLVKFQELT